MRSRSARQICLWRNGTGETAGGSAWLCQHRMDVFGARAGRPPNLTRVNTINNSPPEAAAAAAAIDSDTSQSLTSGRFRAFSPS